MKDKSAIILLTRELNVVTHALILSSVILTTNSKQTETCLVESFLYCKADM